MWTKANLVVISFLFSIFRENLEKYSVEMRKLTVCLLKFMSRNLGLDSDTFTSMFEEGSQAVRLNLYPPCVQANKVMGLGPHSDLNGLSLVVQVNDVQGLQIKKNGKWVPVKPVPGGFIVNIGDLIEVSSVTRTNFMSCDCSSSIVDKNESRTFLISHITLLVLRNSAPIVCFLTNGCR